MTGPSPASSVELGGRQRVAQWDDRAAGVPLAVRRGRERQVAERAVLRVGQRVDDAAGPRDAGQRQSLRVDQLDRADRACLRGDRLGQGQRHRAAGLVERRRGRRARRWSAARGRRAPPASGSAAARVGSARAASSQASSLMPVPAPVVVAEVVRSGFVEGHHHGSVVALAADGTTAWSVGDVTSAAAAALVQQAAPGARAWSGSAWTCRRSCSRWPAPRTAASRSTSTAYAGSWRSATSTWTRCRPRRTTRSTTTPRSRRSGPARSPAPWP